MKKNEFKVEPGEAHPLGATAYKSGVNFSIFSSKASSVKLLLFEHHNSLDPCFTVELDQNFNKTYFFWHVFIRGMKHGNYYAFRIDGKDEPGTLFNKNKVLIDPYAKANSKYLWDYNQACNDNDNIHHSMRSLVIDSSDYDWEGDEPLKRSMHHTIIYEAHVGGFTKSESSNVSKPGTFKGLMEKIPYLKELGITAVELLPVFDFDSITPLPHIKDTKLTNYWGYSTVNFFSPHSGYCVNPEAAQHVKEFKDLVKELHKAGIEIILDVVFNHTYEGNENGPVYSFKGIDTDVYYMLGEDGSYLDYTGCGNTVNCNHPIVAKFIEDCLCYWVEEMHIDGFRFDEASILARDIDGKPLKYPPLLWAIQLNSKLEDTKVIAEAWDAAGLYQVGYFPGFRSAEWNGKFRDDVRRFVRGDPGVVQSVAARIAGSYDIYQVKNKEPVTSINFLTAHDGFTLNDLVSYNNKHNLANGENNNDGADDNISYNYGVEGETNNKDIFVLRERQMKNFATILLLAQGVPMILAGDEVKRTQNGNNNAYCQDNEISWFDWRFLEKNKNFFRFWKEMIRFRKQHNPIHKRNFFCDNFVNQRGLKEITWHGTKLNDPGWDDPTARALAFTLGGRGNESDLHVMMNMYWGKLEFEVPDLKNRAWFLAINTFNEYPHDISDRGNEKFFKGKIASVEARSIIVLFSKDTNNS